MIDISKCNLEDIYEDKEYEETTYYFTYPKSMDETEFYPEDDYGNVVCMCVSIVVGNNGVARVMMSPTVDEDGYLSDADWRDLYDGVNYKNEDIERLIRSLDVVGGLKNEIN